MFIFWPKNSITCLLIHTTYTAMSNDMNANAPQMQDSLRRKLTTSIKNRFAGPPPPHSEPQVVLDRQNYIDCGFCDDCNLIQHQFPACCNSLVNHEWIPCGRHLGFLPGLPGINVAPTTRPQRNPCQPCSLRAIEEKKLANFLKIRGLNDKKWNKIKHSELDVVSACEKAREMSPEELDE